MADDIFSVRDKIVVITGGTGQLGRQFAHALVERGAKVAVFDLRAGEEKWTDDCASSVQMLSVDVTRRSSIETALHRVSSTWGVPHALVNAAALDSPPNAPAEETGPFESYPEASWDTVMGVNVKGVFLCCQVIGSAMAAAGRGSIVNISSIYGVVSPDQRVYRYPRESGELFVKPVAYSASKSALLNLTRYLATYWADRNVRTNTVTFGGVYNGQDERFLKNYTDRVPLGRMARADEYNGAIIFLITEASSYMTGANLIIDGGWTAW